MEKDNNKTEQKNTLLAPYSIPVSIAYQSYPPYYRRHEITPEMHEHFRDNTADFREFMRMCSNDVDGIHYP